MGESGYASVHLHNATTTCTQDRHSVPSTVKWQIMPSSVPVWTYSRLRNDSGEQNEDNSLKKREAGEFEVQLHAKGKAWWSGRWAERSCRLSALRERALATTSSSGTPRGLEFQPSSPQITERSLTPWCWVGTQALLCVRNCPANDSPKQNTFKFYDSYLKLWQCIQIMFYS